jgi:hypothetical protein
MAGFSPNPVTMNGSYSLEGSTLNFSQSPSVIFTYTPSAYAPLDWTIALVKLYVPSETPGVEFDEKLPPVDYFNLSVSVQNRVPTATFKFVENKYETLASIPEADRTDAQKELLADLTLAWIASCAADVTILFGNGTSKTLQVQLQGVS